MSREDEWDVDDHRDWADFQDEARRDRQEEARREAEAEEREEREYLHCGSCGFRWTTSWNPSVESVRRKLAENPYRCPQCGSLRKAT